MMYAHRSIGTIVGIVLLWASGALSARAADGQSTIQTAAGCAPQATAAPTPRDALRVVGAQDTVLRTLLGPGDLVIIGGGTARGVQLGQQFFVRRPVSFGRGTAYATAQARGNRKMPATQRQGNDREPRGIATAGWVRVVSVSDTTAIASVEFACDGILSGDYLESYVAPTIPPDADRSDTSGELDFASPGRVLFGDNERRTGGPGDFMVVDVGESRGATSGARFSIYRDVRVAGVPLAWVGEAIIVSPGPDTSVVRLTSARDAVQSGDLLIPRKR